MVGAGAGLLNAFAEFARRALTGVIAHNRRDGVDFGSPSPTPPQDRRTDPRTLTPLPLKPATPHSAHGLLA